MQSENATPKKRTLFTVAVCLLLCAATIYFALVSFTRFETISDREPIVNNVKENAQMLLSFMPSTDSETQDAIQSSDFVIYYTVAKEQMASTLEVVTQNAAQTKETVALCDAEINSSIAQYQEALRIAAEKRRIAQIQSEIPTRPGMVGRLLVSSVGIDVALIYADGYNEAGAQAIVDAADSCAYVPNVYIAGATVLADHANQDFGALKSVSVGTKGKIVTADGTIDIVATSVFNGHNYGHLTDGNGATLGCIAPYIAYTCLDNAQNVRIVGWSIC